MASADDVEIVERSSKKEEEKDDPKDEEKGGFIDKVKDFIQDIGEKIEETIGFGKPTADVSAIHVPKINLERAEFIVDVLVKNPNPVPIPLIDINYLIDSDGRKLVSGLIPDAGTIHAHGSETVKIPVTLIYDDIKSTYHEIKPGSIIPYRIKVDLIVDVPVFGRLTLPLEKTGEIPIPYKPDIDLEKIHFERFSFEETVATLHLKIENKNDFDLGLNALDYEVWLGSESIGGADLEKSSKLNKNGISYIDLPITFRPKDFGSALWHMMRGKGIGYSMKGNIHVDTPFGAMKLPISKEGGTTSLKKTKDDREVDNDEDEDDDKWQNQNIIEEDRISHLSDDVIERIMELLPARDAGRTCVLSSKWRYVWANHPSLVLDYDFWYRFGDELDTDFANIFRSMVLHHVGHIRRLEFFVPLKGFTPHSKIDSWLSHLCRKGLKDLVLYLNVFVNLYPVPCFLFSTSTLTCLSLGYCIIKGNDSSVCLTNIQSLSLEHVTLDSCVLSTPLLTFLRVRKCSFILDFHIFAPKLASLKYDQNASYMNLIPFSSCIGIENLCIFSPFLNLNKNITYFADGESRLNLVNMLAAWHRISKLEIDGFFLKYLATGSMPCILQPNNLTSLRLVDFYVDSRLIPWILCILKNSPLLHTIEITISAFSMEEVIDIDETLIMELSMKQLRTVKMINFRALRNEVMFAEILLKCAPSLEKMIVGDCYGLHPNERINILKKLLLLLQRSFSKPQIVFGRF